MAQSLFGLPDIREIPHLDRLAYRRLASEIRRCGWEVAPTQPVGTNGCPRLTIERFGSHHSSGTNTGFKVEPGLGQGITIRHSGCLSVALEEIRRQFIAVESLKIQDHWEKVSWVPRVGLRGIRFYLPLGKGRDRQIPELDYLQSLGFNAALVDALEQPIVGTLVSDETKPAEWEESLRWTLDRLGRQGWWRLPLFPIQMDLAGPRELPEKTQHLERPLCRQRVSNRSRLIQRFEAMIRRLPKTEAVGFTATGWSRCGCPLCEDTPFEEEAAYYLRAYLAVLKRYAPDTELWFLPDSSLWESFQEIRSQVPASVRFLRADTAPALAATERIQPEAGELVLFEQKGGSSWLNLEDFQALPRIWDESGIPQLVCLSWDKDGRLPVDLGGFMAAAWAIEAGRNDYADEAAYRVVLPPDQWKNWRHWKRKSEEVGSLFTSGNDPAWSHEPLDVEIAPPPGGANLIDALSMGLSRWNSERQIIPLANEIWEIPDRVPITPGIRKQLLLAVDQLGNLLADSSFLSGFETDEVSLIQDLNQSLSLVVSESSKRKVWRREDLPSHWIEPQFPWSRTNGT